MSVCSVTIFFILFVLLVFYLLNSTQRLFANICICICIKGTCKCPVGPYMLWTSSFRIKLWVEYEVVEVCQLTPTTHRKQWVRQIADTWSLWRHFRLRHMSTNRKRARRTRYIVQWPDRCASGLGHVDTARHLVYLVVLTPLDFVSVRQSLYAQNYL